MIRKMLTTYAIGFSGINQGLHAPNLKEKFRYLGMPILAIFAGIVLLYSYVEQLTGMLSMLEVYGQVPQLLAVGVFSSLLFAFMGAILKSANIIFQAPDLEFWRSTPMSLGRVLLGKTLIAYLFEMAPALFFMIPPIILVGNAMGLGAGFYLLGILGTLLLPIPAFSLGLLGGLLLQLLFKGRAKVLLVGLLCLAVIVLSFTLQSDTLSRLTDWLLVTTWLTALTSHFLDFVLFPSLLGTGGYVALHLVLFLLVTRLAAHFFDPIQHLFSPRFKAVQKQAGYGGQTPERALFRREAKRYFSTSILLLNTLFSSVILVILTVALLLNRESAMDIVDIVGAQLGFETLSLPYLGVVIAALMGLTNITASSISLEGKQFSLLKSFPVPVMTVFWSKMKLNLAINLVSLGVCLPFIFWVLPFTGMEMLLTAWLAIGFAFFPSIFGLLVNLKLPVFDWQSETAVVKQSMSVMVATFANLVLIAGPAFLGNYFGMAPSAMLVATASLITLANIGAYLALKTKGTEWFLELEG
ncbi:MAG: hypothetical protein FWF59_03900 [Turicibacter sp.]|nr:hypothetical protein [Turicibacter sp.]